MLQKGNIGLSSTIVKIHLHCVMMTQYICHYLWNSHTPSNKGHLRQFFFYSHVMEENKIKRVVKRVGSKVIESLDIILILYAIRRWNTIPKKFNKVGLVFNHFTPLQLIIILLVDICTLVVTHHAYCWLVPSRIPQYKVCERQKKEEMQTKKK